MADPHFLTATEQRDATLRICDELWTAPRRAHVCCLVQAPAHRSPNMRAQNYMRLTPSQETPHSGEVIRACFPR